ncbi:MAG: tRNA (guanosine(37)-N1)-methyltransferase TrmD [Candidatus Paceibacterota bacterium]
MKFHVITAFPHMILPVLEESMMKRALKTGRISVKMYDLRDYTDNKHKKIDARPYGGGPGMVLQAEPILRAHKKAKGRKKKTITVLLSPRGEQWTSGQAQMIQNSYTDVILICGHYEGIDKRVENILNPLKISIGPFVVTGGELPALMIIDSVARFVPGVLGNEASLEESRVSTDEFFTRPEVLRWNRKTYGVPEVLLSGNHKDIEAWRSEHL